MLFATHRRGSSILARLGLRIEPLTTSQSPREGGAVKPQTKRILTWLGIIFAVFMIATQPETAAEWVRTGVDWVATALNGLFDFFEALV